ncbi:molybdopterin-containing oxidoreductase family protein [Desulfitobacterium metallireducens]|uniref:molybdopterin-containing oxidoreductase family protein n=1 Tax=Desulfitobacterium metallireducens TaxID=142877 RepID=UPI001930B9A8|nr:molybdopterin oxidoreductase family protein [Desulfitobacterium metallireducens]
MEFKYSVCPHDCPDTCAWKIELSQGRIQRIMGDPLHPVTQGVICEKAKYYVERIYGSDRVLFPMRRSGPKGSGQFERISWEEAMNEITQRWQTLIDKHGAECILPYSYAGTEGIINKASMDRRFFNRLASTQLERTICSAAGSAGYQMAYGASRGVNPLETVKARFLLFWGINVLETNLHQAMLANRARQNGAKIVVIDIHLNKTAKWADEFYQILPGSDGALALGLAHVIVRDGVHDLAWIEKYIQGFKEFNEEIKNYPPERVAKITGLTEVEVVKLAHEYGEAHPSFIRIGNGFQHHENGGMSTWAIACLPALTGAWKDQGGGLLKFNSGYFPLNKDAVERPDLLKSSPRVVNMNQLGRALTNLKPSIYALYVYNSNPAAVAPEQKLVLEGLAREDLFTVVHEQVWTDTARWADLVLPATTHVEHADLYVSYWHGILQWADPIIPRQGESKPNIEVFQELAQRMGFQEACFQETTEDIARSALMTSALQKQGIDLERLKAERYIPLEMEELPFIDHKPGTPSGKIELYSERAQVLGLSPVPTYIPLVEGLETEDLEHPLMLISPPHHLILNSTFAQIESVQSRWRGPELEIHPEDALVRGIHEGDEVEVYNDRGSCQLKAVVRKSVLRGVVVTLGVWWPRDYEKGIGINALTPSRLADMGNGATFFSNRVEVRKVYE